jgi:curli biogenesis system outer membrane secretion channel CsgG
VLVSPCIAAFGQATVGPQNGAAKTNNAAATRSSEIATELGQKLLTLRRLYVEPLGDDTAGKQLQSMVITSLTESKRFIVTENKEKADAVLKGAAVEKTSQELHAYSDSTVAGHAGGAFSGGTGGIGGAAAGISDSSASTETINDARIAVRLVDRDGDVIWSTTQESKGAKYKGATADVAEKVVKQLLRDLDLAERTQGRSAADASGNPR